MEDSNPMPDKHKNFDASKLNKLKDQHCGYRFCPRCGGPMEASDTAESYRMACLNEKCGFIFYQNPIPAAGAIIVKNDSVLLVKRAHPPRIGWWCIPAGYMEWKEHPRETAIRELAEETGLNVRLISLFDVYSGTDDPRANAILVLYLADVVGGDMKPADDALDVRYFPLDHLPEKIAFTAHIEALDDYIRRKRTQ